MQDTKYKIRIKLNHLEEGRVLVDSLSSYIRLCHTITDIQISLYCMHMQVGKLGDSLFT